MYYRIADLIIDSGTDYVAEALAKMPEFGVFTDTPKPEDHTLLHLSYVSDKSNLPIFSDMDSQQLLYHTIADGTDISFSRTADGRFILKTVREGEYLLMTCSHNSSDVMFTGSLTKRLLKYSLWIAYGISALRHGRVPVHSSAIEYEGKAYLFLGESGTGKSTHTRLWHNHIEGARLLNDDSPIVACRENGVFVFGSPWSGKTPCYRKVGLHAGGFTRLSQARHNEIKRLGVAEAFAALHPSMTPAFSYDPMLANDLAQIESHIISQIPVCAMKCLPEVNAARISHSFLTNLTKS